MPTFPDEAERWRGLAKLVEPLSPEERIRAGLEEGALLEALMESSPVRDRQLRLMDEEEAEEHRFWRDFLRAHRRAG